MGGKTRDGPRALVLLVLESFRARMPGTRFLEVCRVVLRVSKTRHLFPRGQRTRRGRVVHTSRNARIGRVNTKTHALLRTATDTPRTHTMRYTRSTHRRLHSFCCFRDRRERTLLFSFCENLPKVSGQNAQQNQNHLQNLGARLRFWKLICKIKVENLRPAKILQIDFANR